MTVNEQDRGPFAFLLRNLRLKAGWTQEELAEAATLTPRAISALECGTTRKPHDETVLLLADALMLEGDARAEFERVAKGHQIDIRTTTVRASGPSRSSRTLPRDVGPFTGRDPELRELLRSATKAGGTGGVVRIVAIGGMAGIGKTALAVHAGHLLAGDFPDGQIFLPLHGHTPGLRPADTVIALEGLLRLVGITEIPDGVDQRAALWRQYLAGKRVLLVLDDAVDSQQVRPLLPGMAGCLTLITSRRRLRALEDIDVISLDVLHPADARQLLVDLVRRPGLKPDDLPVREIARLCGYLPLAIGMVAAQLRDNPSLGAATLASRLSATRRRLELMNAENLSVATAFDMSYRDLDPARQRMFRRLGVHPGTDIDPYAAAALDGTDVAAAGHGLDILHEHCLLVQTDEDRYTLHDLVREYARALAETDAPADRSAAITRLLDSYLHTAREADRHLARRATAEVPAAVTSRPAYGPELTTRADAIAWLTTQNASLYAAADYAATHGLHAHATAIPAAMSGFVHASSRWRDGIAFQLIALSVAEDTDDQLGAANALTELGWYRHVAGEHASALRNLTRAVAIQHGLGNRSGEARALSRLGAFRHSTGNQRAAARDLRTALALYRDIEDRHGEARMLYSLGVIQYEQGKYRTGTAALTGALRLFRDQDDGIGQADAISYLAAIKRETGHYRAAAAMQMEALAIYRDYKDRHEEAGGLIFLAAMQYPVGDYATALENLRLALDIYRDLTEPFGEASALSEMSVVQRETGDLAAATASLERSLDLYREQESLSGEAEALSNQGAVQTLTGDYAEAAADLGRALDIHRERRNPNGIARTLNNLGDLALTSGTGSARASYEEALAVAASTSQVFEEARAREGIGLSLLAAGRPAPEGIAWLEQSLEIFQRIESPYATRVSAELSTARADGQAGR